MIPTKVAQVRRVGFIRPEIGRISLNRHGSNVAVQVWEATPAIKSVGGQVEEVGGEVPDISCIHLVTGLVEMGQGMVPVNQRTSQVLIVEPKYLPAVLNYPDISHSYDYLALCTDLFERTGRIRLEQKGWINLAEGVGDVEFKQELFRGIISPQHSPALIRTGLVNLCKDAGILKGREELSANIIKMSLALSAAAQHS